MTITGLEKEMFRLDNKKLGINNLVIEVDPDFRFNGKTAREFIHNSKYFLAEFDSRGIYLIRPEFETELTKNKISYSIIARYPMPKEERQEIRRQLKENGVFAQL